MLSVVFRFKLPELGDHRVLRDLIWSFAIERPHRPQLPPLWDLEVFLRHLMFSAYEPLESLVTAKRVGELQALSKCVCPLLAVT